MFHWESIAKVYFIAIERFDKSSCQIQAWENFVHIFVMHQISLWEAQNIIHEDHCLRSITLKSNELKVYISLKGNELTYFTNYLRLISGTPFIWLMISEKGITRCMYLCGKRVVLKAQEGSQKNYVLEKRFSHYITFMWTNRFYNYEKNICKSSALRQKFWITQLLCTFVRYLQKNLSMEFKMMSVWWCQTNSLLVCNIVRFFFIYFCGIQISYKHSRLQNTGKHGNNWLWLLWKQLC